MTNEERQIAMYGCPADILIEQFANALSHGMMLMGMLSDMQELLAMGDNEKARQYANRVKFLMSEYLPKDEAGRML